MFVCVNLDDDISKYIPQVLYKILNLKLDIYIYGYTYTYILPTYLNLDKRCVNHHLKSKRITSKLPGNKRLVSKHHWMIILQLCEANLPPFFNQLSPGPPSAPRLWFRNSNRQPRLDCNPPHA